MPYVTVNLKGGLGNQLFQIFTTIAYAMRIKYSPQFDTSAVRRVQGETFRPRYWDNLLKSLKEKFGVASMPPSRYIMEPCFHFFDLPSNQVLPPQANLCLDGYFQSYKYFQFHWPTLSRMIQLETQKAQLLEQLSVKTAPTISLHFRWGDYKRLPDCHPVLPVAYYEYSLAYMLHYVNDPVVKVMYFCEDEDRAEIERTMIAALQSRFTNCEFVRCPDGLEDWQQMLLMSCCQHNVIANSTFSWWAAYCNSNDQRMICYPSVWFGVNLRHHDLKDLFPGEWTKINC